VEIADILLPVQYNELTRRRSGLAGEQKLLFAVLEDAVECYLKHMKAKSRSRRLLFCEVDIWMSAKDGVGLFSYQTLCESLGIDAKALRTALVAMASRLKSNGTSDCATIGCPLNSVNYSVDVPLRQRHLKDRTKKEVLDTFASQLGPIR